MQSAFAWPEGKRAAVSLSFDDARSSQIRNALPILGRHDVKATFYVKVTQVERAPDTWACALRHGHEIGNHSLHHACTGNFGWKDARVLEDYTFEEMEQELLEANRQLRELLGQTPATFAYPCGQTFVGRGVERRSYVPAVARHFIAGRGFRDEHFNNPQFCDLAKLGGTELDGVPFEELVDLVERAASTGCWIAFAGHDVFADARHQVVREDDLDRFCAYCRDPANGVWIDPIAAVASYVRDCR